MAGFSFAVNFRENHIFDYMQRSFISFHRNYGIRLLLTTFVILLTLSCHRKAIHKDHPEFIGMWIHHDNNSEHWYIDISNKSWGTITVYDANYNDQYRFGENPHRWRYNEKKNELTLRLIPDKFHVDQLPIVASTQIIDQKDTIDSGETYCILDGAYYRKQ